MTYEGFGQITVEALLNASANAILAGVGAINATSTVTAKGKILGEEWSPVTPGSESWNDIPPGSDTWTDITGSNNTWLPIG
jgi:hypothetical protein